MRHVPFSYVYPSPARAWYLVILLTTAYVFSFVDKYLPALLIEPIKHDLGASDTQMGLLLGPAFAVLYATLGLPLGWLADRTRRTTLVAAGVALWSLATAVSGLARNFSHLIFARVGVGVGDAALAPCALSLISSSFPPAKRGRPVALYIAAQSFGAGLAMLGGAVVLVWAGTRTSISLPVVGSVAPWQLAFLVMGLPGLLIALLLYIAREPQREPSATGDVSIGTTLRWLRERWRTFGSLAAVVCVMTIVAYSQNWYAALFQRQWGWDITRYATWSGLALIIVGPLVVNTTGWWCDRLLGRGRPDGPLSMVIGGTVLLLPPGILAPLMPTGELAFGIWLINLCGLSMVSAAAPVALLAITPGEMRGQMSALFYMVIMLAGLVIGPLAVGLFNDQLFAGEHLNLACALVPVVVGVPGLALLGYARQHYARETATDSPA
ncbi:MAG: MFS transporter [Gammaproteobacteria bacterium]|nr:MFS transporter [Gammaproteobacteria bacterium]